jgi:hypothetical protein
MDPALGLVLIAAGWAVVALAWFPLRAKLSPVAADAATALAGVLVGIGGLLLLTDVGLWSWLLTPTFLALAGVVQRRVLFAGAGPLRT